MNTVTVPAESVAGQTEEEKLANLGLAPEFKAAVTAHAYAPLIGEQSLGTVFQRIGELSTRSVKGNSKDLEYMLTSQAIVLDSIFNRLAIQAHASVGKHPKVVDTYLRLALKAQSQCRATAEALAVLKSPRQYINQTNVAGAMQINIERESTHVDRGAEGKDAASNPTLEALGEVDGAEDPSWEGGFQQELIQTRGVCGTESQANDRVQKDVDCR
jgi:hypothetical protein